MPRPKRHTPTAALPNPHPMPTPANPIQNCRHPKLLVTPRRQNLVPPHTASNGRRHPLSSISSTSSTASCPPRGTSIMLPPQQMPLQCRHIRRRRSLPLPPQCQTSQLLHIFHPCNRPAPRPAACTTPSPHQLPFTIARASTPNPIHSNSSTTASSVITGARRTTCSTTTRCASSSDNVDSSNAGGISSPFCTTRRFHAVKFKQPQPLPRRRDKQPKILHRHPPLRRFLLSPRNNHQPPAAPSVILRNIRSTSSAPPATHACHRGSSLMPNAMPAAPAASIFSSNSSALRAG